MEEERDFVVFTDDDGNDFELDVIDYFDYKGEEYAVLIDTSEECDCGNEEECDCDNCDQDCDDCDCGCEECSPNVVCSNCGEEIPLDELLNCPKCHKPVFGEDDEVEIKD